MTIYIEVVQAKNETPVKEAAVRLQYQDGSSDRCLTDEMGVAEFAYFSPVTIYVNGHLCHSQLELEDEDTVTVAMEGSKLSLPRRFKKIRLRSFNPNPILPAGQPAQRQVTLQVQAPHERPKVHRSPLNLSLVIDQSWSMQGEKIHSAIEAAVHLLQLAHRNDRMAVVTFNQSAQVILPLRQLNPQVRDELIERLRQPALNDQCNLSEGWLVGAKQSLEFKEEHRQHWVLLITDGLLDAGLTDQEALITQASELYQQGLLTYTLAVGHDANHSLLQAIARAGGGEFYIIEQPDDLPDILKNRLKQGEVSLLSGHQAVVEVTLPDSTIQVALSPAIPHTRQPQSLQLPLGEIQAGQQYHLPLTLNLPPYPIGHQICLPVTLRYLQTNTLLPIVVKALPLCFMVVGVEEKETPPKTDPPTLPQPQPQPALVPAGFNPVWAILSGGVLFVLTALVIVGALFIIPQPQPQTGGEVVSTVQPPVVAAASTNTSQLVPTTKISVIGVTATDTPVSTALTTGSDTLHLPSPTPPTLLTDTPIASATAPTSAPAQPVEGLRIGNIAPDFTLGSNRASRVSLSELRGKIVILNFWASWCSYCAVEVPTLEAIHNEYGPQGVVVLTINQGESLETVERFAWDNNIHFAVWLDEDQWAGHIYEVRGIPTTYFLDRDGIIREVHNGTISRDQVVTQLEKMLK